LALAPSLDPELVRWHRTALVVAFGAHKLRAYSAVRFFV
jgi:hypothetical protein